ncbi:phosphomevalonate kinase [Occultella glacieicola]|uniref:phosphomevalonate kinase n=1 Tax=Occultella glacieicola TaxID=2518684 RepID=A0ABY2DYU2_9MICO|nr:phosphomevalonate kinase [Occultella glacieicola]TDE89660.1 phosphomevalonate kinase [Occultella glacieicola]
MITARAPGKLFIAGEYAVVEPGGDAVVVAVDRHVVVTLGPARDRGRIDSDQPGWAPLTWSREATGVVAEDGRGLDHALSAVRTIDEFVIGLGIDPRNHSLRISSDLDDADGHKYGLGSSGAVTVATIRALDEFYGLGLTRLEQFRLALLAIVDVAPSSSGGDVAASTFGGWVSYRSPDRAALAELRARDGVLAAFRAPWAPLAITPLPSPDALELVVGWTGAAASTARLVDDVQAAVGAGTSAIQALPYEEFLTESRARVADVAAGLTDGDPARVLAAVRAARRLLVGLGSTLDVGIETPTLTRLCDEAEAIGAAAKSSGAGGGDCGIVLVPRGTDLTAMLAGWERAGVRRLTLAVAPPEPLVGAR